MELRKTYTAKGFTLVELLVVIGLLALLGALALFVDLGAYRGDAFRAEKAKLVVSLQSARANAFNNVSQSPHGVTIFPADHPKSFVIFEGDSYASSTSRLVVDVTYEVSLVSGPSEIVFSQLSANANVLVATDIVLRDGQRGVESTITINHEGAILY